MNKTKLVEAIATRTELTKTDVDTVVTAFAEVITDELAKGEKVSLKGFGNFETIEIKASKSPTFKASSALKKIVNQGE